MSKTDVKKLLEYVGDDENIVNVGHCFTRLRFDLKDNEKINRDAISKLDGVMGEQIQSGQYQVIIGNNVDKVYDELLQYVDISKSSGNVEVKKEKQNPINALFELIAGIFTPILPAIVGAGMLKALIAILQITNVIVAGTDAYNILSIISDATFYFLPVLLGVSAARKFKTDEFLAASLGAILIYPTFIGAYEMGVDKSLSFLSLPIPILSYSGSVIPIILGTYLLSIVYRFFNKVMPSFLRMVFSPLLTLLVVAPLTLAFLGPLGNYIGQYLQLGIDWLYSNSGPLAGMIFAGLMPLIVMTGMHYAFFPTAIQSLGTLGYEIMLLPANFIANMAQAGATLAVSIKSKDEKMKSIALSSGISAVFGITEPAMYGVTMKLKKPFYIAMGSAAIGGGIASMFGVRTFAFAAPGILSLPTYISPEYTSNFMWIVISLVVSFFTSFILTLLFGVDNNEIKEERMAGLELDSKSEDVPSVNNMEIKSIVEGKCLDIKDIDDKVFADEIMGPTLAFESANEMIYAPFNESVTVVQENKHAIGLTSDEGVELLIHVGIDTVSLMGEGFDNELKVGQKIVAGQVIMSFDKKLINSKALSATVFAIVTDSGKYTNVDKLVLDLVNRDSTIFKLSK